MASVVAMASGKTREITFSRNIMVNDTLVKKGTYKVTFDSETNELTVAKNKSVVARATARWENLDSKSAGIYTTMRDSNALYSVIFDGGNGRAVIAAKGASQTASEK